MSRHAKRRPDLAEWKAAAQAHASDLGLPDDLWAEADDYDLVGIAAEAFAAGVDPKAFVEGAFDEDLARMEHESDQWAQSLFESDE